MCSRRFLSLYWCEDNKKILIDVRQFRFCSAENTLAINLAHNSDIHIMYPNCKVLCFQELKKKLFFLTQYRDIE